MIAVIEYSATANLSEFLLSMNKTSEAIITTGVAAKWNQPRNFGGDTAASFSRSSASLLTVTTVRAKGLINLWRRGIRVRDLP